MLEASILSTFVPSGIYTTVILYRYSIQRCIRYRIQLYKGYLPTIQSTAERGSWDSEHIGLCTLPLQSLVEFLLWIAYITVTWLRGLLPNLKYLVYIPRSGVNPYLIKALSWALYSLFYRRRATTLRTILISVVVLLNYSSLAVFSLAPVAHNLNNLDCNLCTRDLPEQFFSLILLCYQMWE